MSSTDTKNGSSWSPPYGSFKTLMNTVSRMADEGGVPSRIDRSYLSNMPGSVRATFLSTLRSLNLIDGDAQPTERLTSLVDASEEGRKELIGDMIAALYADVVELPPMATQAQLETVFRNYGVSGSTMRKAIAFFLAAASFAGLTGLSQHFRVPKDPGGTDARPRSRRVNVPTTAPAAAPVPLSVRSDAASHPLIAGLLRELPAPGEMFPQEKQEAWFTIAKATFQLIYKTNAPEDPDDPEPNVSVPKFVPGGGGGDSD